MRLLKVLVLIIFPLLLVSRGTSIEVPEIKREIRGVVIHHTDGEEKSVDQIRQDHLNRGFQDIAYHYVVFPDGRIEKGRDVNTTGAGVFGVHEGYVEIVMIGHLTRHPPTPIQFRHATQLAAQIAFRYHLKYWKVRGHREVAIPHHSTDCPGMSMREFRLQVEKEMYYLKGVEDGRKGL